MFTPRPSDPNIANISSDPNYCMERLKSITEFNDAFDEIQKQLEMSCSPSVAHMLFQFSEYLTFILLEDDAPKFEERKSKFISLLLKQNLAYEDIICHLIVEHRIGGVDKFCMELLQKLLVEHAEFRAQFADDKKYQPLFKRNFINDISKKKEIALDWDSIKSTPVQQGVINDAIERVYSFKNPYSDEQKSIVAVAKILTNKETVLTQFAKAEASLAELINLSNTSNENDKHEQKKHPAHKILTNFLYEWAEKNDFGGITKLLREVPEHEMLEIFKHALLWKDKGVRGGYHGEFVHFWQWFIVAEANKEKPFLLVTTPELLRWIGTQPDGDVIWDKTFEGSGGGPGPLAIRKSLYRPDFDARNFNNLNTWMLSNECKALFPNLHSLMQQRSLKHKGFIGDDTPTQTNTRYFKSK